MIISSTTWLSAPILLSIAFVGFAGLLVLWRAFRRARRGSWRDIEPGFLLVVGGAAMNVAIFVSAHRLWGFYLLPGMVLLLVGLVASMEASFATLPTGSRPDWGQRFVALVSLGLGLVLALFYWLPQNYAALNKAFRSAAWTLPIQRATMPRSRPRPAFSPPIRADKGPAGGRALGSASLLSAARYGAIQIEAVPWGPYTQWQSSARKFWCSAKPIRRRRRRCRSIRRFIPLIWRSGRDIPITS